MPLADNHHGDLFDRVEIPSGSSAGAGGDVDPLPTLAIPCGFHNRRNAPCRRLGARPVTIGGEPFHHRGCRVVHCDPACFRDGDFGPGNDPTAGHP